jgi:MarR family multiple antibiotic resistance transcriptional regulator
MKRQRIIMEINSNLRSIRRSAFLNFSKAKKNFPTLAQMGILRIISEKSVHSTKDIAKIFRISPPASTQFINELVKKKLIVKQVDKGDKRQINLKLTEKGEKIQRNMEIEQVKFLNRIFKSFDNKELAELDRLQKKLVKVMS